MAKEVKDLKTNDSTSNVPTEPSRAKERWMEDTHYTIGQRAFIATIPDSEFPLTLTQLKKKVGVL